MAAAISLADLEKDPRLFLYTSLTAGSSHIISATSRMETILKANKIPFQAIDLATDEKARRLWQRRAGQRKLPGLVKEGFVLGDLAEVEEWNEFGELKENIGPVPANNAAPPGGQAGVNIAPPLSVIPTATQGTTNVTEPQVVNSTGTGTSGKEAADSTPQPTGFDKSKGIALPGAAEIAARNKPAPATIETPSSYEALNVETMSTSPAEKKRSIEVAKAVSKDHPMVDHLSAPASAIHSGSVTPQAQTESQATTATTAAPATDAEVSTEAKGDGDVKEVTSSEAKEPEKESVLTKDDEETVETSANPTQSNEVKDLSNVEVNKSEGVKELEETKEPEEVKQSEEIKEPETVKAPEEVKNSEEVKKAEEVKKPEDVKQPEISEKTAAAMSAQKGIESLSLDAQKESGTTPTQEQSAKAGEDAGKSVED